MMYEVQKGLENLSVSEPHAAKVSPHHMKGVDQVLQELREVCMMIVLKNRRYF